MADLGGEIVIVETAAAAVEAVIAFGNDRH